MAHVLGQGKSSQVRATSRSRPKGQHRDAYDGARGARKGARLISKTYPDDTRMSSGLKARRAGMTTRSNAAWYLNAAQLLVGKDHEPEQ
jgi:hypothetical protein